MVSSFHEFSYKENNTFMRGVSITLAGEPPPTAEERPPLELRIIVPQRALRVPRSNGFDGRGIVLPFALQVRDGDGLDWPTARRASTSFQVAWHNDLVRDPTAATAPPQHAGDGARLPRRLPLHDPMEGGADVADARAWRLRVCLDARH